MTAIIEQAISITEKTGKTPDQIYAEHQEMLETLCTQQLSNPDNVLLRNLIEKVRK